MNNLIELQDVNLIRNGKALLKEINWQVKENECWAILGLNGAGKSTLFKAIMGVIPAHTGTVEIALKGEPSTRRRLTAR